MIVLACCRLVVEECVAPPPSFVKKRGRDNGAKSPPEVAW